MSVQFGLRDQEVQLALLPFSLGVSWGEVCVWGGGGGNIVKLNCLSAFPLLQPQAIYCSVHYIEPYVVFLRLLH